MESATFLFDSIFPPNCKSAKFISVSISLLAKNTDKLPCSGQNNLTATAPPGGGSLGQSKVSRALDLRDKSNFFFVTKSVITPLVTKRKFDLSCKSNERAIATFT